MFQREVKPKKRESKERERGGCSQTFTCIDCTAASSYGAERGVGEGNSRSLFATQERKKVLSMRNKKEEEQQTRAGNNKEIEKERDGCL